MNRLTLVVRARMLGGPLIRIARFCHCYSLPTDGLEELKRSPSSPETTGIDVPEDRPVPCRKR